MAEPTLEELLAAISAGGSADPNAPIGVPSGYQAPFETSQGFQPGSGPAITVEDYRPDPYMPGDDLRPASLPPERIIGIQQSLVDAGLLRGRFQAGVWDATTRNAYRTLLGYANQLGTTDEFALRRWAATGMGEVEPASAPRQPFVATVSNPDDIRALLRDAFREKVGSGKIDDARLDAMVKAYQGSEVGAQRSQYDAQETGGTVTAPPDISTFADIEARKTNPVGYRAHQYIDKFSAITEMLGGGPGA